MTVWPASDPESGNTWLRVMYSAWSIGQPPRLGDLQGVPNAASRQAFEDALIPSVVECMASATATVTAAVDRFEPQVRQRLGTWSEHLESWLDQDHVAALVVRCEDCVQDSVAIWSAVFAGLEVDHRGVLAAVAAWSFYRLQDQEKRHGFDDRTAPSTPFVREGGAEGWRAVLPAELAAKIPSDRPGVIERFGYLEGV